MFESGFNLTELEHCSTDASKPTESCFLKASYWYNPQVWLNKDDVGHVPQTVLLSSVALSDLLFAT